jgi:VWFA-related protein
MVRVRYRNRRERRSLRPVMVLLLLTPGMLLAPNAGLAADDGVSTSLTIADVDVSDHPTVRLIVDAPAIGTTEDEGGPIFTVTEDGGTREVTAEELSTEDLAVVLVIDTSGSMGQEPMAAARDAAIAFTTSMPPAVKIAVIGFSTDVTIVSQLTDDRDETTDAISALVADGWTSLYDAVEAALDLLDEVDVTREAIVLLSDGEDTRSTSTLDGTRQRLQEADVALHAIEFVTAGAGDVAADDEEAVSGIEALNELVAAAGEGSVVSAADAQMLNEVYRDIAASLTNRYRLLYTSEAVDNASLVIRYETASVVATGSVDIELRGGPDPQPEAEAETPVVQAPIEPLEPLYWAERWMLPASLAVFGVGLLAALLYFHGWRLKDRFDERS